MRTSSTFIRFLKGSVTQKKDTGTQIDESKVVHCSGIFQKVDLDFFFFFPITGQTSVSSFHIIFKNWFIIQHLCLITYFKIIIICALEISIRQIRANDFCSVASYNPTTSP